MYGFHVTNLQISLLLVYPTQVSFMLLYNSSESVHVHVHYKRERMEPPHTPNINKGEGLAQQTISYLAATAVCGFYSLIGRSIGILNHPQWVCRAEVIMELRCA